MDYTFLADLHKEFAPPEDGILSRILHKDERGQHHAVWLLIRSGTLRTLSPNARHPLFSGWRS